MADSLPPPPAIPATDALLIDFDGTLVELAEAPDRITVAPGLGGLLERLSGHLGGRMAIVSGRPVEDLDRHVGPLRVAVSGSHGLELRFAGALARPFHAPPNLDAAREEAVAFAEAHPGVLLEDKPGGFALHFRAAPQLEERLAAFAADVGERTGLRVQHGKMVAELGPAGVDKGEAVRRIMAEPPFAGARPWFVGDDLTDEHGFEAAAALSGGGVLVGPMRPTAARWRLEDVSAVLAWLDSAARAER